MIRDPADGSVKPKKKIDMSGLPPIETEDRRKLRLRLEASREWLQDYQARRAQCGRVAASSASSSEEPTN